MLIDLTVPRMNGMEAAIIKNIVPETCIILFTLNGDLRIPTSEKVAAFDLIVWKAGLQTLLAESAATIRADTSRCKRNI